MPKTKATNTHKSGKNGKPDEKRLYEIIEKKAYEIYEKMGREEGKEMEHWLEAERMVIGKRRKR